MRKPIKMLALLMALVMLLGVAGTAVAESTYAQSPALEGKDLPPVAERMPVAADIMVEEMDDVGQYTATFTMAQGSSNWTTGKLTEEPLFRFKTDGNVEPNVAKGYDVNEDATVWTIYLREGMRWSDGEPFTAEDCRFFYEEVLLTGFSTKSVWGAVKDGNGEVAKMAVLNDYCFTMTFDTPKPAFLQELAINGKWFFAPKHWMIQYMPAEYEGQKTSGLLTAEEWKAAAEKMGYSDLKTFDSIISYYYWLVPGRPTLRAWQLQGDFNADSFTMERNPYFWKVDAEGKQLPYIDSIVFLRYQDENQPLLWSLDGTIDLYSPAWTNIVEMKEAEANGTIKVMEWNNTAWAGNALQLNQATKDDELRALFQNVDFRHALSIAVDRAQICALVDDDFSVPSQSAPQEGQMGYDPEWVSKWTEYDVEQAKELLVKCGLTLGQDGTWYFPSGKQVAIHMIYQNEAYATLAELLVKYYSELGLKVYQNLYDRSYVETLQGDNEYEAVINPNEHFATVNIGLRPDYLVPTRAYPPWASEFGAWYDPNDGKDGMEPSDAVKELLAVYDQFRASTNAQEREELCQKMLEIHKENVWEIGYTSPVSTLYAINAKLHNFPETSIYCDEFRDVGIGHPANWWIEE